MYIMCLSVDSQLSVPIDRRLDTAVSASI